MSILYGKEGAGMNYKTENVEFKSGFTRASTALSVSLRAAGFTG